MINVDKILDMIWSIKWCEYSASKKWIDILKIIMNKISNISSY